MKDGIRLSLFDGSAYAPQRDFPQEIVEKLINYIYVHLREKGYTEEGIIAFIKTIFPEDGISVEFNSDDELLNGIELARLTLKNNTELLSNFAPFVLDGKKGATLGIGFALSYAIYIMYLQTSDSKELLEYFKKIRLPAPKREVEKFLEIKKRMNL